MPNTIKVKRSAVAGKVPLTTDLQLGELAINTYDGKVYTKRNNGSDALVQIGAYTVSSTAPTAPVDGDRWFDLGTGITYTYTNDGTSSQWVETGAPGIGPAGAASDVTLAAANAFTGANTFTNATGQLFRQAATKDAVLLRGSATGTGSWNVELVPATLSASRTLTLPDVSGTVITTGDTGTVTNTMLAGSIANAKLLNSSITVNSASTALGGSVTLYAGTTTLQTSSANQALSGISSITLPGATSGSVQVIPTAAAGTGTVLTLPATTGTVVTTGDNGTVTGTMIASGTITDGDINASAAIAGTKISPNFGAQNISTTGTITGELTPTAGTSTAGTAPLKFTSGTNLATAEAGAMEYDGTFLYATPTTTSGRGQVPAWQTFRLTGVGSNIGGTIADFFGATSAINLAASSVYDIEFWPYFQKNTAGTVTWTLTASSAPTVISGVYWGSPVGGIAAGTPITGYAGSRAATTAAFSATASVTNNAFMAFSIKVQVFTNLATTFKLQVTCGSGTVTPQAGSFYTVRQIAGTTGSFA